MFQAEKEVLAPAGQPVGNDPGVQRLVTAVDETGNVLQVEGPKDQAHRKVMRRLRRKMQRLRDAASRDGRARFISQRLRWGKVKQRFRWTNGPAAGYLKPWRGSEE